MLHHRVYVLSVLLLATTLGVVRISGSREGEPLAAPLASIPLELGPYRGVDSPPLPDSTLAVLRPTEYLLRTYANGADQIELFSAYYGQQQAGEAMHSPKNCLPGNGWEFIEFGRETIAFRGETAHLNRAVVANGARQALVLYWYHSNNRIIANEYWGKACLFWDTLTLGQRSGSIVRVTVPNAPDALPRGIEFAKLILPEVDRCFSGRKASLP